jgi:hypothetical protein
MVLLKMKKKVFEEQLIKTGHVSDDMDNIKTGEFIAENKTKHTSEGRVSFKPIQ